MDPFLGLFRQTSQLLLSTAPSSNYPQVAQSMALLLDIFYDLTCQDLPPAIEDNYMEFFGNNGWFFAFLDWDPAELRQDVSTQLIRNSRILIAYASQTMLHLPFPPK
jgi:exportin-2 (importin alpha re-exporter)